MGFFDMMIYVRKFDFEKYKKRIAEIEGDKK